MDETQQKPAADNPWKSKADAGAERHRELCERFDIPEDQRDDISFHHCCNCDDDVPCEAGYTPYAPNGLLWCRSCLEDRGGWCDQPYGAVVRDLEPDKKKIELEVSVSDADYEQIGKDCIAHTIVEAFADAVRKRIGESEAHIEIGISLGMFAKVEMTLRIHSDSRAADLLATDWVSEDILGDDPSSVLEVFDDVAAGTYDGDHYDDDYRRAPLPFELSMIET